MAIQSPFFPGYYPGDPIIRPPRGGGFVKPVEYVPNTFDAYIDSLDFTNSDFINLPRWIKERIVADWKTSMKASSGSEYSVEQLEAYGDQAELPGSAGINISLNPVDWAKDPSGMLVKTGKGWWESVASYSDVDTRFKTALYMAALGDENPKAGISGEEFWLGGVARAALVGRQTRGFTGVTASQIGLKNLSPADRVIVKNGRTFYRAGVGKEKVDVDVYRDAAVALEDFVMHSKAEASRDNKHDAFLRKAHFALRSEFEQKLGINVPATATTITDKVAAIAAQNIAGLTAEQQLGVKSFVIRSYLADAISETDRKLGGGLGKPLGKLSLLAGKENLDTLLKDSAGGFRFEEMRADLEKQVADARTAIAGAKAAFAADAELLSGFEKAISPYEKFVDALDNDYLKKGSVWDILTRTDLSVADRARLGTYARTLRNNLKSLQSNLSGGDVFKSGAERIFLRNFVERGISEKGNARDLGAILEALPRIEGGRRLRVWVHGAGIERLREGMDDFIRHILKGDMLKAYVWAARWRVRLDGFTPAYFTGVFIKKVHAFGAVIDSDINERSFAGRLFNNRLFINRFSVEVPTVGSIRLVGSKDLKVAVDLADMVTKGEMTLNDLKAVLRAAATSGDAAAFEAAIAGLLVPNRDNIQKLYDELKALEAYLAAHPNILADLDKYAGFIKALGERAHAIGFYSATSKFIGWLDRVAQTLNIAQDKVLNLLHRVLSPIVYLRIAISEKIADAVAKAAAVLFAGATEGIGEFLSSAVYFIVRFVVNQVLNFFEAVGKALFKADVSGLFEELEKGFVAIVRILVFILGGAVVIMVMMVLTIGAFISTISPENPARGGDTLAGGGGGGGRGYVPPPPAIAVGTCPVVSPLLGARSFSPTDLDSVRHGSNAYWRNLYGSDTSKYCSYAIPYIASGGSDDCPSSISAAACAPTTSGSVCTGTTPRQTYYGFALDVTSIADNLVYLPELESLDGDVVEEWYVGYEIPIQSGCWGYGVVLDGTDGVNDYKMYLGHIDLSVSPGLYDAGSSIGNMFYSNDPACGFGADARHVHVELMVNGDPVRPEDYMCL